MSEVFLAPFDFLDPAMAASDPWLHVLFISYLLFCLPGAPVPQGLLDVRGLH